MYLLKTTQAGLIVPLDIISAKARIPDLQHFTDTLYRNTGLEFADLIGKKTKEKKFRAEQSRKKIALDTITLEGWSLTLVEAVDSVTGEMVVDLLIKGNPSKMEGNGKNLRNPCFAEFHRILKNLERNLGIPLGEMFIKSPTEPSLTLFIQPEFPGGFIGEMILFRNTPFLPLIHESTGSQMGYKTIANSHLDIKVYSVGKKYGSPASGLRIESRYKNISSFAKYTGIQTLEDYLNPERLISCIKLLKDIWSDCIVYDPLLTVKSQYPYFLKQIVANGNQPQYWLNEWRATATQKTLALRKQYYEETCLQDGAGFKLKVLDEIVNIVNKSLFLRTRMTPPIQEYVKKELTTLNKRKRHTDKLTDWINKYKTGKVRRGKRISFQLKAN